MSPCEKRKKLVHLVEFLIKDLKVQDTLSNVNYGNWINQNIILSL